MKGQSLPDRVDKLELMVIYLAKAMNRPEVFESVGYGIITVRDQDGNVIWRSIGEDNSASGAAEVLPGTQIHGGKI